MRVSYADGYYADIPENHVFPMRKFAGLHRFLLDKKIVENSHIVAPRMVDRSTLRMVHSERYLSAILDGNIGKKEERKLGLPWSPSLAVRSRLAVQGTLNASLMALEDGISGNLAGGTHHAMPDNGEGFCVFNDVAVACKVLLASLWVKRILIIDCDVHQGNGTAHIFADDERVFTFSIHGENNFPFKKERSRWDVGLHDGVEDRAYLDVLELSLAQILQKFAPEIVFYLGGIDILKDDRFGRLNMSLNGLRERDRLVIRTFRDMDIPLVLLLSGGYAPSVDETVRAHAVMFEEARNNVVHI